MFLALHVIIMVLLLGILAMVIFNERKSGVPRNQRGVIKECWGGDERRKHARISTELSVVYTPLKNNQIANGKTKNISMGGACLVASVKPQLKDILNLQIQIPNYKKAVNATGRVVWISESDYAKGEPGLRYFDVGLEFTKLGDENKKWLEEYLKPFIPADT